MKKRWLLAVGLVLVLVVVGLAGCSPGTTTLGEIENLSISSQQEGIWVSGQGKVMAAPDIAILRLGVEAQKTSVAEAQIQATEAMDRVMTALSRNGVAEKDIQTQYFSIRKVTRWDRDKEQEVVIGYLVTNTVAAKIRDIDNAGSIIDAIAEAGGDLTRVDSISFSVDDPSEYYEEARQEAMTEAKAKAQQLAKLAGVTLGSPTYISEGISYPVAQREVVVMKEAMAMSAETSISPGEMEISLTLQVVYTIK
ncbi:SIMPL domain-containing protein [Chloroflexota bacterium]